jgi:hypothetical protein
MRSPLTSIRARRRLAMAPGILAMALLAAPAHTQANVPFKRISSPGPIESIWVGNDLSCQAKLTQDNVNSFFPPSVAPGDCGIFIARGGVIYSPNWALHADTGVVLSSADGVPFTPGSQSNVTGSGTAADPLELVTDASIPGLTVERIDSYVIGSDSWSIKIRLINDSTSDDVTVYHSGDCYLAGSDYGYGVANATAGAVFCTSTPNNSPPGRVIGFGPPGAVPSSGAAFVEGHFFDDLWQSTNGSLYPKVCKCTSFIDNGAGLSWGRNVPANGTVELDLSATVKAPAELGLKVRPRRARGKVGKTVRFTAVVQNRGELSGRVRVCAKPPKAKMKLKGRRCRSATVEVGASVKRRFRLVPKPAARGKRVRIRFRATSPNSAGARAKATVKVK